GAPELTRPTSRGQQPTPRVPSILPKPFATRSAPPLFFFNDTTTPEIYSLSLHDALPIYAAFLGTINPDTNKSPKHLFQGYLNIYNNYFKAPWMPDRTEANPNELNQDDARYGFRCCHLKNIWTAPLPPETELSRQMTTSTTSIDIMGLQAAYANLHSDQERDYFMQRYHDVISSFGGKTSYHA